VTAPVSRDPRAASGIVLAGGRSSRFGRDKLAEPLAGRPLAWHAIAAVAAVCRDVIVVVAPGSVPPAPPADAPEVRVVGDVAPFRGPLAGLLAGLDAAAEDVGLVVGADMPELAPAVLEALLAELRRSAADAVVLDGPDGPQPLPAAFAVAPARRVARELVAADRGSLRGLFEVLHAVHLPPATWLPLDPGGGTLRDIDRPGDLPGPGNPEPPSGGGTGVRTEGEEGAGREVSPGTGSS
jgi:molybdopterin-guanine dinucleotide biosynthesis protein A